MMRFFPKYINFSCHYKIIEDRGFIGSSRGPPTTPEGCLELCRETQECLTLLFNPKLNGIARMPTGLRRIY